AQNPATVQIKGLHDQVVIRRDERGIPYIKAKNDDDLYFAQGYATASDRLFEMDLFRRTARGELAEVLGAGPNNVALDQDKLHRTYGFGSEVEAEWALASPQSRKVMEAYANGVNAYIDSLTDKNLPPEFKILQYKPKPWKPIDSLVVVKIFFEALSDTWHIDLMREALAVLPAEKRAALLPEVSPIDVLVYGKDSKSATKNATALRRTNVSEGVLNESARTQALAIDALARIGFHAEGLA